MDPSPEFEEWWAQQPPMTPKEQREIFLGYLSRILDGMPDAEVPALRARILAKYPDSPERDTLLAVIDGHLALRRLG